MNRLVDPFAAASAVLAAVMVVTYLAVINDQDGEAAPWVVVALLVGAALAAYGALRSAPLRQITLAIAVALLGLLGLVAILSIGVPILLASALALVALIRSTSRPSVAA